MLDKDKRTDNNSVTGTDEKKTPVVDNSTSESSSRLSSSNTNKKSANKKSVNQSNTSINNQTDSSVQKISSPEQKEPTSSTKDSLSAKTLHPSAKQNRAPKQKRSMLAILAILLSMIATAGSAAMYFWQQQIIANMKADKADMIQTLQNNKQSVTEELSAGFSSQLQRQQQTQKQQRSKEVQQITAQVNAVNETNTAQLNNKILLLEQSIQQRKPSDWLIHEAEYLIRIAARTMWLKQDTKSAIGLLKEADSRLAELQQPKFLPVRSLIHQDIETLALMPTLDTQNAILSLMALKKQISSLPLAGIDLSKTISESSPQDLVLSDDISDWKSNLSKSWDKFFDDFIVVRRRVGQVEPLIAPEQQKQLKQSLHLKIQLALWAASEQKTQVYLQALNDSQGSLSQFVDMDDIVSKNFYQALEQAKQHLISYNYPSDLTSLNAIKQVISQFSQVTPVTKDVDASTVPVDTELKQNTDQLEKKPEDTDLSELVPPTKSPSPKSHKNLENKEVTVDEANI